MSLGIKGFTPTSLVDWPGKIAAVIFLGGCSFRCHYCYNPEFIEKPEKMDDLDDEVIFDYLKNKKKWLDGVVMLGGEPTIHKNFLKIVKKIKQSGLKIGVHTNGTNPKALKILIKNKLVDFIAMDIKAPLNSYKKVVNVNIDPTSIIESADIIMNSKIDYEFRTTVVPGLTEKEDIEKIGKWLKGAKRFFIQQFKPARTLNPKFRNVKPFRVSELLEFKKISKPYFEKVEIRGI